MKTIVYCKSTAHNVQSFYMRSEVGNYYLFSQNFRQVVHDYFKNGVILDNAIRPVNRDKSKVIYRTMDKIRKNIEYLEKEYEIKVFNKTKEKGVTAA